MEAIASLVENDPYLRLPFKERLHARRARRVKLWAYPVKVDPVPAVVAPVVQAESWAERQLRIPMPKPRWFSIEADLGPVEKVRPTIEEIQRAVCKYYGVKRDALIGERRHGPIIRPRHVAIYLVKVLTLRSLPEVGRRFGGRDHTSVLFAMRKIERQRESDEVLAQETRDIAAMVGGTLD